MSRETRASSIISRSNSALHAAASAAGFFWMSASASASRARRRAISACTSGLALSASPSRSRNSERAQRALRTGGRGLHPGLLAGVAQYRALGGELRPLGVVPGHRAAGRGEHLPDRGAAVLVEVRGGVGQRLGEVLGKDRGVPLRAGVGGGDHDAALGRQRLDERRARLGGVHDHEAARAARRASPTTRRRSGRARRG